MGVPTPAVLCSFKTYSGTAGESGVDLTRSIQAALDERSHDDGSDPDVTLAVAPQTPDVRLIARETNVPVIAQTADAAAAGAGTGDVLVETLARAGVDAVFVNHPEREHSLAATRQLIDDCHDHGLDAIVCVRTIEEGIAAIELGARWLLFEKPEDIATSEPLVRRHPDRVRSFIDRIRTAAGETDREVSIAVGGGISTAEDVERAFALGVDAIGTASAVVTASDPAAALADLVSGFDSVGT